MHFGFQGRHFQGFGGMYLCVEGISGGGYLGGLVRWGLLDLL